MPPLPPPRGRSIDGCLPRHPGGQGADGVDGLVGVEADATLRRPTCVVVLDAEAVEDLDVSSSIRTGSVTCSSRRGERSNSCIVGVQAHDRGCLVQLRLCDGKGI